MNIIIPCAGLGQRFIDDGYKVPKPLISVLGEPMIFHVIKNLKLLPEDKIYIVYQQDLDTFQFRSILRKEFPFLIFIPLNFNTRGPAETVLCALNQIDLSEKVLVLDCDTFYKEDILSVAREKGTCIFYFIDNSDKEIFSYITFHESKATKWGTNEIAFRANLLTNIKEKQKISNNACSGAYGFISGSFMKKYCEKILNENIKSKGEFYISNIYSEMLRDLESSYVHEVKDFHCLGIPQQLKTFCANNAPEVLKNGEYYEVLAEKEIIKNQLEKLREEEKLQTDEAKNIYKRFQKLSKKITEKEKKRFCFDLDNTLVTFPEENGNYQTVKPIWKNIKIVRYLHSLGHTILIQTSRKMLSSSYNAGEATARAYESVLESLNKYEIPFNELYFGKPHAHFYIDDLSVKPWDIEKEIGFYDTNIEARHFNNVRFDGDFVIKETNNPGEIYYYQNIPPQIKDFFPRCYIDFSGAEIQNTLQLEKINGINFSYLLVNGSLTTQNLDLLFETIDIIHNCARPVRLFNPHGNYNEKMQRRFEENNHYVFLPAEVFEYRNAIFEKMKDHKFICGVIHGDLVFSNIFLCENSLKFIDMRGKVGEEETIFGDIFYDYGKIYQSLWGYDYILNDAEINESYLQGLREYFEVYFCDKFSIEKLSYLKYITAGLLFSLIPLHADPEKQMKYFELMKKII